LSQVNKLSLDVMIDPDVAVMLLIEYQSGLFQPVKDMPVPELRRNVIGLAKTATLLKIPVCILVERRIFTQEIPRGDIPIIIGRH
jgi:hypothetical protein